MTIHDLRSVRQSYDADTLDDGLGTDPLELFGTWLGEALQAREDGVVFEANAMTLSTVSPLPEGGWQPESRVVLLKSYDEAGFVFYTNYESEKGRSLAVNPHASLLFHWPELQRQVRIDGPCSQVSREESEEYFLTRPRSSQVAAWASEQSRPVSSRRDLEEMFVRLSEQFAGAPIACPPSWGGYRVTPNRIEFWQGRASRLHDRMSYTRDGDAWQLTRLCP